MRALLTVMVGAVGACAGPDAGLRDDLAPLLADLDAHGQEPVPFVLARLREVDLIT